MRPERHESAVCRRRRVLTHPLLLSLSFYLSIPPATLPPSLPPSSGPLCARTSRHGSVLSLFFRRILLRRSDPRVVLFLVVPAHEDARRSAVAILGEEESSSSFVFFSFFFPRVYCFFRASHGGSPTRRAAGPRDRHALSTTSFFRSARILVPKKSPYSVLTPLPDVHSRKRSTGRSRNKSHVVRADDTRARGRRDDRRMHQCTPVHTPSSPTSLSLALWKEPVAPVPFRCDVSTRFSRITGVLPPSLYPLRS